MEVRSPPLAFASSHCARNITIESGNAGLIPAVLETFQGEAQSLSSFSLKNQPPCYEVEMPHRMPETAPELSPFAGTAPFYDRFRAPYAQAAIDFIVERYHLGDGSRALDLGCGPGTIAIPLSYAAAEVVAVDADAEMIAEGKRLAASRQILIGSAPAQGGLAACPGMVPGQFR
jgi:Methyltransferase domain